MKFLINCFDYTGIIKNTIDEVMKVKWDSIAEKLYPKQLCFTFVKDIYSENQLFDILKESAAQSISKYRFIFENKSDATLVRIISPSLWSSKITKVQIIEFRNLIKHYLDHMRLQKQKAQEQINILNQKTNGNWQYQLIFSRGLCRPVLQKKKEQLTEHDMNELNKLQCIYRIDLDVSFTI